MTVSVWREKWWELKYGTLHWFQRKHAHLIYRIGKFIEPESPALTAWKAAGKDPQDFHTFYDECYVCGDLLPNGVILPKKSMRDLGGTTGYCHWECESRLGETAWQRIWENRRRRKNVK